MFALNRQFLYIRRKPGHPHFCVEEITHDRRRRHRRASETLGPLAGRNEYVFKLIYRAPPGDIATVIDDTKKIARHVLVHLMAKGWHPASDHTFLWVWAQTPAGKGETGEQLVHMYGHLEYNYDNDRLEFKPWKP
jgi:hypothetical protein